MNCRAISYVVQEVKILENSMVLGTGNELTPAAAKSIPVRAMLNLGKGTLIGAGVTDGLAAILNIAV
jgi:hypothetical protein